MYSVTGDTTSLVPGFPIRTSSDPRSVDSSPRLIAASYVLHRLPVPRHPPCALKHLQTQKPIRKEIAHQKHTKPDTTNPERPAPPHPARSMLATTIHKSNTTPHHQRRGDNQPTPPPQGHPRKGTGLLSQSPIVCLAVTARPTRPNRSLLCTKPAATTAHGFLTASHLRDGSVSRGAP